MATNQDMQVEWSEIIAECGDFRTGFVSVFKKYEGKPTDEKDGQGRTVKVTATSFARHVGVDESTFRRWVRAGDQDERAARPARDRVTEEVKRDPQKAAPQIAKALTDPKVREQVAAQLDQDDLSDIAEDLIEREFERAKAAKTNADRKPTLGELTGKSPDQMGREFVEGWVDSHLDALDRRSQRMARAIAENGVQLSPEDSDEAMAAHTRRYAEVAERIEQRVAEVRVALQERVRDEKVRS